MTEEGANDAAMAAMGLPVNFAAPAFPKEKGTSKATRPPPPGPSNRGGRGRDGGWGERGRGRGAYQQTVRPAPYQHASRGRSAAYRGGHQSGQHSSRGNSYKNQVGRGGHNAQAHQDGPLPSLDEIRESRYG